MNKRGFLLGEFTLKTVVALVCILLLIFLLYSIYSSFSGEEKIRQAEATLQYLEERASIAASSEKSVEAIIVNPKNWILMKYEGDGPLNCGVDSCLCLCDGLEAEDCESKGFCIKDKNNVAMEGVFARGLRITGPTEIALTKSENKVILGWGTNG